MKLILRWLSKLKWYLTATRSPRMKDNCENCGDLEELFYFNCKRLCRICKHDTQEPTEDDLKMQAQESKSDSDALK